jgi:hypothetical protein
MISRRLFLSSSLLLIGCHHSQKHSTSNQIKMPTYHVTEETTLSVPAPFHGHKYAYGEIYTGEILSSKEVPQDAMSFFETPPLKSYFSSVSFRSPVLYDRKTETILQPSEDSELFLPVQGHDKRVYKIYKGCFFAMARDLFYCHPVVADHSRESVCPICNVKIMKQLLRYDYGTGIVDEPHIPIGSYKDNLNHIKHSKKVKGCPKVPSKRKTILNPTNCPPLLVTPRGH